MSQYIHRHALARLSVGSGAEEGGDHFRRYGQEEVLSQETVDAVYDAAGNLVAEIQEAINPDLAPLPEEDAPPSPVKPTLRSRFRDASNWLMDADSNDSVSADEAKVFGMGLLSGYLISKLLR